jgi:hypothetical protein
MYLAGVLVLCALHVSAVGRAGNVLAWLVQPASVRPGALAAVPQEPATPDQPKSQPPDQSKTGAGSASPQSGQAPPSSAPVSSAANPPSKTSSRKKPSTASKNAAKQKSPSTANGSSKTVVREGSTSEPTTQLSPGMTSEQAARQRETTNQLLSSTDSALHKLSGRQLSSDDRNTVAQIRKLMEQAKSADNHGDLELSYKLALKAHLLSDALTKQ